MSSLKGGGGGGWGVGGGGVGGIIFCNIRQCNKTIVASCIRIADSKKERKTQKDPLFLNFYNTSCFHSISI